MKHGPSLNRPAKTEKLGDVMKKLFKDVGTVFRNFRKCFGASLEQARRDYHIPKSRFRDPSSGGKGPSSPSTIRVGEVFRSFFNCLANAMEDARKGTNLPRRYFQQRAQKEEPTQTFQVTTGFDESLFVDSSVKRAKLDSSVLPGPAGENVELQDAAFDAAVTEGPDGRLWDGPKGSD